MAVKPASSRLMAAQKWPVIAPSLQCEEANLTHRQKSTLFGAALVFFLSFFLLTGGSRVRLVLMCLL